MSSGLRTIDKHLPLFRSEKQNDGVVGIEGHTCVVSLPEEEPKVVAYYIEHGYFGKLHTDIYTAASSGSRKELGYELLAQLYVLAELVLASRCRNRIPQEFLRLRDLECATG
jgi:hypothetical protein